MRHNGLLRRWHEPGHQKGVLPHFCYHRLTQRTQQIERVGQDKDPCTGPLARLCTWAMLGTEARAGKIIPLPSVSVLHWAARQPTGRTLSVTQRCPWSFPFCGNASANMGSVWSHVSRCYLLEQMTQWHPGWAQCWMSEGAVAAGSLQPWGGKAKGKPCFSLWLSDQRIKGRWSQSLQRGAWW